MRVTHTTTQPAAQFNDVNLRPLVFVRYVTSLLRPGIKPWPPSFRSDALTTTLPASLVTKFRCRND